MTRVDSAEEILGPVPAQQGHFLLESGYHTDLWFSLDALFVDPIALAPQIDALAALIEPHGVSAVCGPLLGGAFLAQAVATRLRVRFYYCQPSGDASGRGLFAATYNLAADLRQRAAGERVAVVDDVISAGSSVRAATAAMKSAGSSVVVVGALLVLGHTAIDHFSTLDIPVVALGRRTFNLWLPAECPHCRIGVPLQTTATTS